ncbi:MAG: polysaccharide export protein [Beijerinckiaceae bacterium]|nr:polysaccharide export protein [Beijerinckiaceae bacterium]
MVSRFSLFFCLAVSVALAGCAQPRYRAELFDTQAVAPYRLASGDRLRIIVFGQDSLTNSYAVDGAGRISMPLIGLIDAYGLTTADLERRIEGRLRGGFLREPRVSVEVEAYRPFFVLGEVTAAGQYPYINGMTVQNALAVSGGFAPRAQRNWVELTRIVNGEPITGAVPISHPILPGDTITVKERFF